ncbi:F-box protein [Aspergillus mulundensis]|uniref:F-box domain-containing protein n=1 Tax=Aspergillus mulundensis TaxID=1810919 RepID=A0A3D8SKZ1_9EURO|nr:hypothetical protein DSM5745_03588 [Aspergillus mulundensis]RDW86946.1 hypothetical protein DSM5745_03588 [Aspergillus mulundensis]
MSATETVLCIPELLEHILFHLDMQDLLVSAQRVNKHWHATITTSPKLQQALFFRPISQPAKPPIQYPSYPQGQTPLWKRRRSETKPYTDELSTTLNPLLVKHFGSEFFNTSSGHTANNDNDWVYLDEKMQAPWSVKVGSNLLRTDETGPAETAFRYPTASWRRMLVSQPPQPGLGYIRSVHDHNTPTPVGRGYIDACSDGGLRFGVLYDLVQTLSVRRWKKHHAPFRITWGAAGSPSPSQSFPVLKGCMEVLEQTGVVLAVHYEVPKNAYYPDFPQPGALRKEDFELAGVGLVDVGVEEGEGGVGV